MLRSHFARTTSGPSPTPRRGVVRHRIRFGACVLVGLLASITANAQRMQFRHLSIDDGLPSSLVSDILQDQTGFMWMATARGVSRYDGHHFRNYVADHSAHSLPISMVDRLYEDRRGTLWVVTVAGVSRYEPALDGFVTHTAGTITRTAMLHTTSSGDAGARAAAPAIVTSILEDHFGRLLVGTSVGLFAIDRQTGVGRAVPVTSDASVAARPYVTALFEDHRQQLWVGTRLGLIAGGRASTGLPTQYVRDIAEDARGRLWVATMDDGIVRLDVSGGTHTWFRHRDDVAGSLAGNRITRLLVDRASHGLWFGVENAGVDYLDLATDSITHHRFDENDPMSIRSNSIWALAQDASGLLWVGTFSGGIDIAMRNSAAIQLFQPLSGNPATLSFGAVPSFSEDAAGTIWITTDGGGVNRFDPRTAHFDRITTRNSALPVDAVLAATPDPDGTLWLATWGGGLVHLDPRTRRVTWQTRANSDIPDDHLYEVLRTRAGQLWIGTDGGVIARRDPRTGRFTHRIRLAPDGFDDSSVLLIREMSDGRFAIALRDGGLVLLNPETDRLTHVMQGATSTIGIASNRVRALYESAQGVLWVGGEDGLDRLDLATETRTHFGVADGLASANVEAITMDAHGALWISTDHGITRLDPVTRAARTLTRLDGLQGNEFLMRSAFRARDGTLYFGGNQGFNVLRPELLRDEPKLPTVTLTDLLLFNRTIVPGTPHSPLRQMLWRTSKLRLSHTQDVVGFEFSSLDFSAPERTRYAYRLDGFDTDWQSVDEQHIASYTNLAPGDYLFRVRASGDDGVWTTHDATVAVTITPPFWATWWFRLLVTIIALAALHWLWRFQQRRRLEVELSKKALHDSLTGLGNRMLFENRAHGALLRLSRMNDVPTTGPDNAIDNPRVAVLFLDLDNFKLVNDSFGHHAGDQLLRVVSGRLLNATRGSDTVARFGGDEFAVLLENMVSASDAYVVAERITAALRAPIQVGDATRPREARVGVSVGIAFAEPTSSAADLIRNADAAMYRAKKEGKGRHAVFDPASAADAEERLELERGIGFALERGELSLAYQPIVLLRSGQIVGAEALLRWTHPDRGPISPARFIPLAEASGAILELGQWALDVACHNAVRWPNGADGRPLGISVNVSWRQLLHPALLAQVREALTLSGLAAERLTLEITESVLMRDTRAALSVLHALKELGVRLAVDDFGTEYSSLRYLQQFPIDILKIDKSFVDHVAGGAQGAAVARMIVALGQTLGMRMVAEGVEHVEQSERLLGMGCEYAQGYLFSHPLSGAEFQVRLASGASEGGAGAARPSRRSGGQVAAA